MKEGSLIFVSELMSALPLEEDIMGSVPALFLFLL